MHAERSVRAKHDRLLDAPLRFPNSTARRNGGTLAPSPRTGHGRANAKTSPSIVPVDDVQPGYAAEFLHISCNECSTARQRRARDQRIEWPDRLAATC